MKTDFSLVYLNYSRNTNQESFEPNLNMASFIFVNGMTSTI
jgi:hypothetical protein